MSGERVLSGSSSCRAVLFIELLNMEVLYVISSFFPCAAPSYTKYFWTKTWNASISVQVSPSDHDRQPLLSAAGSAHEPTWRTARPRDGYILAIARQPGRGFSVLLLVQWRVGSERSQGLPGLLG